MHVSARFLALGTLFLLLAGCEAPPQAVGPTVATVQIPDRDAFIDTTLTLLRELDLPPRRVDRERGMVVSQPSTSGQWFEFWRGDSRGAYQLFESSLHTMRRIVTISIEPESPTPGRPNTETHKLDVAVEKERYSAPERQVTTASGALAIYNERLPTEEGLRGGASRGEHWTPLGRDLLLEEYLLERILERTRAAAAPEAPTARTAASTSISGSQP